MSTTLMKWIDQIVGIPLCFLLSPLAFLLGGGRTRVRNVVFIKLMGMGSIVLTTPTVRAVRKRFPSASLVMVTFAENRPLVENIRLFTSVFYIRKNNFIVFTVDTARLIFQSWVEGVDVVVDFEFFSRFCALLSFLMLAPRRLGFYSSLAWRGWLLTDRIHFNHYRHMTENFLSHAQALGADIRDKRLTPIRCSVKSEKFVENLLESRSVPTTAPIFIVNVNASDMCLERRWPPAYYAELIASLQQRFEDTWFVFTGTPGEAAYVRTVLQGIKDKSRVVDLSGALFLSGLAALMKRARLIITSESGPLHFAQSVDLPSVSMFGPGPRLLFAPTGPLHRILYAGVGCSPCLNYYNLVGPTCQGNNICMKYVRPPAVLQAVEDLVASLAPSTASAFETSF